MLKFFLVEERKTKQPGMMMKIVIPNGLITFQEMKKLKDLNQIVMIDDYEFKVFGYEDDMLSHEPNEAFTFFGKLMFGLLVEIPRPND